MHSATPALIVVALLNTCIWSGLLWQLWALRHSFEIAARAPVLVGISGVGALTLVLAIFVHWILLLESKGLPCYVMLMASYFCIAVFMSPYLLRAIQLVVAYNTHYRLKYARYVKRGNILKMAVVIGTAVLVAALLIFWYMPERYSRGKYGCYFFNERRVIEGILILGVGPTIFAMLQLMKVRDAFGIGSEIVRVIIPLLLVVVTEMIIQELLHANVLEGSRTVHFWSEFVSFLGVLNVLFWSALIPVSRYQGWHGAGKMYVLPMEGQTFLSVDNNEGVYDYAQEGGEVAEMFGEFCRKSLCMESWEFIMDCVAYKTVRGLPRERFPKSLFHLTWEAGKDGEEAAVRRFGSTPLWLYSLVVCEVDVRRAVGSSALPDAWCRTSDLTRRSSFDQSIQKLANPNQQSTCFIRIMDTYLRSTSPQEVNLSSKMQDRLLPFKTISAFTSLDEKKRSTILDAPVGDIVLMLEQNILDKFKLTPGMQQREERKLVELEIQSAYLVADGDKDMLALITSASLGKIGSPMKCGATEERISPKG